MCENIASYMMWLIIRYSLITWDLSCKRAAIVAKRNHLYSSMTKFYQTLLWIYGVADFKGHWQINIETNEI